MLKENEMKINALAFVGFCSLFICGASVLLALPGLSDPQSLLSESANAEKFKVPQPAAPSDIPLNLSELVKHQAQIIQSQADSIKNMREQIDELESREYNNKRDFSDREDRPDWRRNLKRADWSRDESRIGQEDNHSNVDNRHGGRLHRDYRQDADSSGCDVGSMGGTQARFVAPWAMHSGILNSVMYGMRDNDGASKPSGDSVDDAGVKSNVSAE